MTGVDIFSYLQEISVIVEIHYKIALYLLMSFEDYFESLVCVCHISTPTDGILVIEHDQQNSFEEHKRFVDVRKYGG